MDLSHGVTSAKKRDPYGRYMVWLCSAALAFNLLMVGGMIALLVYHGFGAFWPARVHELALKDGTRVLGEIHEREERHVFAEEVEDAPDDATAAPESDSGEYRLRLKVGNKDLTDKDFVWVDESEIETRSVPPDAAVLERVEWGNFYGYPVELRRGEEVLATAGEGFWDEFEQVYGNTRDLLGQVEALEKGEIDDLNYAISALRLERRGIEKRKLPAEDEQRELARIDSELDELQKRYGEKATELFALRDQADIETLVMRDANGTEKEILLSAVVDVTLPNALETSESWGVFFHRMKGFLLDNPREANTEGGIFPAIFGTVMMVFLMTLFVVPLGVLAALYLREYAKDGVVVRLVRIAVNNLAGVPSIVFGVFGLGFFVYLCGNSIDALFYSDALPTPTFGTGGILWASLTLALLTLPVVIVATEEGLAAVPSALRAGSLALGATKWETIRRVVLPSAFPGVLTGTILAMARAAGEVAPLMIVGMVKLADTLPVDHHFPYVHVDRKFMHLGFHIYDVGFQSPNVEAGKPLVFATSLLLVVLVVLMNLVAIAVRNHLRSKYTSSSV